MLLTISTPINTVPLAKNSRPSTSCYSSWTEARGDLHGVQMWGAMCCFLEGTRGGASPSMQISQTTAFPTRG